MKSKNGHGTSGPREISGTVVEVLKGCGSATVETKAGSELRLNKGTGGVHFDQMRVGQPVSCIVSTATGMVLHAHQQTTTMSVKPPPDVPEVGLDFDLS